MPNTRSVSRCPLSVTRNGLAAWLTVLGTFAVAPLHAKEPPVSSTVVPEIVNLYEERSVRVEDEDRPVDFRYRLLRPERLEGDIATNSRTPLVLFLHGAGERGSDNINQLKYLPTWLAEPAARRRHPCFVLAPQCRMDERWVDVSWADGHSAPQSAKASVDLAAAMAAQTVLLILAGIMLTPLVIARGAGARGRDPRGPAPPPACP